MGTIDIDVSLLRNATNIALASLEESKGTVIQVEQNFFWFIQGDELHHVDSEPTGLTIGWTAGVTEELERIVQDPEVVTNYALIWLSQAFREVGEAALRSGGELA